jgi:hypothetical protein
VGEVRCPMRIWGHWNPKRRSLTAENLLRVPDATFDIHHDEWVNRRRVMPYGRLRRYD